MPCCAKETDTPVSNQPNNSLPGCRVVAMPCAEWFAEQDASYQEMVLPAQVRARVSLEHFGESADYQTLYREFGFTTEHVVTAAKASLARLGRE